MAPEPYRARATRIASLLALSFLLVTPAHAFRIVNYNLTNYPGNLTQLALRQPEFRNIVASLDADIFVVQEVQSQAGVDSFLTNVLDVVAPGSWAAAPFVDGNDTNNALFYKPSRIEFLGGWEFYPNPAALLRLVNCYRLRPVGTPGAEFRVYSQHLKASNTSADANQRLAEAIGIRDSMNAAPPGTHMILCGDFNIYRTGEPALQRRPAHGPAQSQPGLGHRVEQRRLRRTSHAMSLRDVPDGFGVLGRRAG